MRRPLFALPIMALFSLLLLSACSASSQPVQTYPISTFSCCVADEISSAWHPGQTVTLHWAVQLGTPTTDNSASVIIITGELIGPYKDVATLKSGSAASRIVTLATIKTTNRALALPPSVFTLPANLAPGFYDLQFNFDYGGGNGSSSASVIQVSPAP
jgi:hypothetical protein